jgi:hypothetical protein
MRAIVDSAPKDNQQQQWPTRGLKKVDNAPKDNKEAFLFARWVHAYECMNVYAYGNPQA